MSQPSASQRLSRLERRVGIPLFDRDTQGARPTPAGVELARQAEHILGHLAQAFDAARAAGDRRRLRIGTFASLTSTVLPLLDTLLDVDLDQVVDHGDRLLGWLDEGTLDAAVVAIADQIDVPAGVKVHRIGRDDLALFLPRGVRALRAGRQPLRGRRVVFATYDAGAETIRRGLIGLGADAHRAATAPTALATARLRPCLAVVPRSGVGDLQAHERVQRSPFGHRLTLRMVLPRHPDDRLVAVIPALKSGLALA